MRAIHTYLLITSLLLSGIGHAQYSALGSASQSSCNCFEITPDQNSQTGGFYSNNTLDLNNPVDLNFSVLFGCDNTGGSGMAFILQTGAWVLGNSGYGLGYGGLNGSLAVEFDTRDNEAAGNNTGVFEQTYDHISLQANGSLDHNPSSPNNLTGTLPGQIIPGNADVEDCQYHDVQITWDPVGMVFEVYVDGNLSLSYTGDIINNVFSGTSVVYWGWSGTTANVSNQQAVCVALTPSLSVGGGGTICPGTNVTFSDNSTSQYPITSQSFEIFDDAWTSLTSGATSTFNYTFPNAGEYHIVYSITDNTGCTATDTLDVGIGINLNVTADDLIICPGATTVLHANATPYVASECQFTLELCDTWGDDWAGNKLEVIVDGVSQGLFEPANNGGGGLYCEDQIFMFDQGSTVDFVFHSPTGNQLAECQIALYDQFGATVFSAPAGTLYDNWNYSLLVDCGATLPNYSYSWSNPGMLDDATIADPTATVSPATAFDVTVTDQTSGCSVTGTIFVDNHVPDNITISGNETICEGDVAYLQVSGMGNYSFEYISSLYPGMPIPSGLVSGNPYSLPVTDSGFYSLDTAIDLNGCGANVSGLAHVTVIGRPDVDIEASASYCQGEPIADLTVISGNGGSVTWYDNAALTNVIGTGNTYTPGALTAGSYNIYAVEEETVSGLGCAGASDMVTLTINPIPAAPGVTGADDYCDGDVVSILNSTTSGGLIGWYTDPALTAGSQVGSGISYNPTADLTIGTNTFYVSEMYNGCQGLVTTVTIEVSPTPGAPTVSGTTDYCEGNTVTPLSASGMGGTMYWGTDPAGISNQTSGGTYTPASSVGSHTYYVHEELNGCVGPVQQVVVTIYEAPTVSIPYNLDICVGDSIYLEAQTNGYPLTWNTGDTTEGIWIGPTPLPTYTVTATHPQCGSVSSTMLVTIRYQPTVYGFGDTTIALGGEVDMWATGALNYVWEPDIRACYDGECSEVYEVPTGPTAYVVTGYDQFGCWDTDTVYVDVQGEMELFVPNIFSPNNDGWNDELLVLGPRMEEFSFKIYSRWGELLFESDSQEIGWDGTDGNGNYLNSQVVVYYLQARNLLNVTFQQTGNITVIR